MSTTPTPTPTPTPTAADLAAQIDALKAAVASESAALTQARADLAKALDALDAAKVTLARIVALAGGPSISATPTQVPA